MTRLAAVVGLAVACLLACAGRTEARALPSYFEDQIVVGNLFEPNGLAFLPDGRVLVIERGGRVRLVVNGKLGLVDPLLEPDSVDATTPERGLLGIAVDPGWPARPFVYVLHTRPGGRQRLARYEASGDLADGSSVILAIDPGSRHLLLDDLAGMDAQRHGGGLAFGADGRLYVGLGDDGDECAAQEPAALRGVVLRLDTGALPLGPGGPAERSLLVASGNPFVNHPAVEARLVWAFGLRDPARLRMDPRDGSLFLGDVGETGGEEIDRVPAGGLDFGWPHAQGDAPRPNGCETPTDPLVGPVWSYFDTDAAGGARVVGGGVYVGSGCASCDFPAEYVGDYFYADARLGFVRRLRESGGTWSPAPDVLGQPAPGDWGSGYETISDLVPGPDGALWYCHAGTGGAHGEVRRIVYAPPTGDVGIAPPAAIDLLPPAPSPMRARVSLDYRLERAACVELAIFDASGRRVCVIVDGALQTAGRHAAVWDGRLASGGQAPPGLYVARLSTPDAVRARRFPRLR